MSRKIGLVPLDDRPCNVLFPKKIGEIAQCKVLTPPKRYLGNHLTSGKPKKILRWLRDVSKSVDVLIVSCDMLCYGGLVSSRRHSIKFRDALQNLNFIKIIKRENPKLKIYLFSTITRLTLTAGEVSEAVYKDLFEYSKLAGLFKIKPSKDIYLSFKKISKKIPAKILKDYLYVRQRNFRINKIALSFVRDGIVDFLVLGKDDVSEFGLHKKEESELLKVVKRENLYKKVKVVCGIDEIATVLIARFLLKSKNIKPKVFVEYSFPEAKNIISLYEDQPVDKTILDHLNIFGAKKVYTLSKADLIFYIHTSFKKQGDIFLDGLPIFNELYKQKIRKEVFKIKSLLKIGKPLGLVDIAFTNGADPVFMECLLNEIDIKKVVSFSAWNTAGNSIGLSLAQAFSYIFSNIDKTRKDNLEFIFERIVDDYFYQSIIREEIKKILPERRFVFNLGRKYNRIKKFLIKKLFILAKDLFNKHFRTSKIKNLYKFSACFPWKRIFEVRVNFKFL